MVECDNKECWGFVRLAALGFGICVRTCFAMKMLVEAVCGVFARERSIDR